VIYLQLPKLQCCYKKKKKKQVGIENLEPDSCAVHVNACILGSEGGQTAGLSLLGFLLTVVSGRGWWPHSVHRKKRFYFVPLNIMKIR
jgi:hypothetical protein